MRILGYHIFILIGTLINAPSLSSQERWDQISPCPQKLTVDNSGLKLADKFCFFNRPASFVKDGAELDLDTVIFRTVEYNGNFPEEIGYACDCVYGIKNKHIERDFCDPSNPPDFDPETSAQIGTAYSFFWLDKFEPFSERLCRFFENEYGIPGSRDEYLYQQIEVSESHKTVISIHWDTVVVGDGQSSPHNISALFEFESLQRAIDPFWSVLQEDRSVDVDCRSGNIGKSPAADFLLLKNRWPIPGDQIDSIVFGQFSDSLPAKVFDHEICLSLDFDLDNDDLQILSQKFNELDFKKLDPNDYEAIDKEAFLAYKLAQFYVDNPIDCQSQACPRQIDLTEAENGIYNVLFKADSKNVLVECDETNNVYPGVRIEIDDFNPGECAVCPPTVEDNLGVNWTLSEDLPDCSSCSEEFPPTSGKVYYDGQSYLASCVYERPGVKPVALAWIRWQESRLSKDSVVFLNNQGKETTFLHFCELETYNPSQGNKIFPDIFKAMIGAYGHPDFPAEAGKQAAEALINCYEERAIALDSMCGPKLGIAKLSPENLTINLNESKEDTISIFNINRGLTSIESIEVSGDLLLEFRTEKQLPTTLLAGDSLLVFVKVKSPQNLDKKKCADLF